MARKPKAPAKTSQAGALLDALKFVSVASENDATLGVSAKHVRMSGNMAVCYDGQLAAGHPIAEELNLCPQLDLLTKALNRCGKSMVISETEGGRLSVKGDKMRAVVECLSGYDLAPVVPDANIAVVDDRIKAAFKCCGILASENGKRLIEASLLLRANDCTGSNGSAILQFWHGIDLPPNMVLPKVFCAAVAAVKAPLVGFGFSWAQAYYPKVSSVTFWFEGGAWLKSQCYNDEWPPTDQLWQAAHYNPVPEGFFEAIDTVADFNKLGFVSLVDNGVHSHRNSEIGAQYNVPGLQGGKGFAGKLMAQVAPFCNVIDLTTHGDRAFFAGGDPATPVRGIVMGIKENTEEVSKPPPKAAPERRQCPADGQACTIPDACSMACQRQAPEPQPAASSDGWAAPGFTGGGWSGDIDDDVEIPF